MARKVLADDAAVVARSRQVAWDLRRSPVERNASGNQAHLTGPGDGLGAVGRAELAQDMADVLLDRVQRDHELAGDGLIRARPPRLAGVEPVEQLRPVPGRRRKLRTRSVQVSSTGPYDGGRSGQVYDLRARARRVPNGPGPRWPTPPGRTSGVTRPPCRARPRSTPSGATSTAHRSGARPSPQATKNQFTRDSRRVCTWRLAPRTSLTIDQVRRGWARWTGWWVSRGRGCQGRHRIRGAGRCGS